MLPRPGEPKSKGGSVGTPFTMPFKSSGDYYMELVGFIWYKADG